MLWQCSLGQLLDSANLRFDYSVKSKEYLDCIKAREDWFRLDVGKSASVFYSVYKQFSDSTFESLNSMGLSPAEIFEKTKMLETGSSDFIYKNYKTNTLTFTSEIFVQKYWYNEEVVRQDWDLNSDTTTILGYPCMKAKCNFRGREWRVWYTTEIPISNGPWKLNGLPGLILKAEDSKGDFIFECKGVRKLNPQEAIVLPVKESKSQYVKTDGKTFLQIKRKSIDDIKGSIAAQGMTVLSVTDANGNTADIPTMEMNAIELYE